MPTQDVRVTSLPKSDRDSIARVALELAHFIRQNESTATFTRKAFLDLYAECYRAANGTRHPSPPPLD